MGLPSDRVSHRHRFASDNPTRHTASSPIRVNLHVSMNILYQGNYPILGEIF